MDNNCYTREELCEIINNTRANSSNPYKLFIAYVLASLSDLKDDEEQSLFDMSIDKSIAINIVKDCTLDFKEALKNGCSIEINGKSYTIRNKSKVKSELLDKIFQLPSGKMQQLKPEYIFKQDQYVPYFTEEKQSDNMLYFQKIVMLSDSTNDGYDKLTDIEAAVYCWGLFHSKNISSPTGPYMYQKFYDKYKDYFDVGFYELTHCVNDGERFPYHYWSFSVSKIKKWNKDHNQKSYVNEVDNNKAVDFWYDIALRKRFLEK